MFKAGTIMLTACLFTAPALAQEDSKSAAKSDAVIQQLQESLAKAEAALKAGQMAEIRAKEEAVALRQRAEEAVKAATLEHAKAVQAQAEAEKLKAHAEEQRLELSLEPAREPDRRRAPDHRAGQGHPHAVAQDEPDHVRGTRADRYPQSELARPAGRRVSDDAINPDGGKHQCEGGEAAKPIAWGPSPRASQALMLAVRARALLDGRLAPSIDDVLDLAEPVLKHRMALTFTARAEGETIEGVVGRLKARIG